MRMRLIAGLSALFLIGCAPRPVGGGGGPHVRLAATRADLSEAYLEASRAHAAVVRDDYPAAAEALRTMHGDLARARAIGRPEAQGRIDRLDGAVSEAEAAVRARSVAAYAATLALVDQAHALMVSIGPIGMPKAGPGTT